MAKKTPIFQGTVAEVEITLKSEGTDFKIGDKSSVPELQAEFYIAGSYNKAEATKVTIDRDNSDGTCFTTDDPYTLAFHVDTKNLKAGNLAVTFKGKYVDTEHDDAELAFVYSSEVNAEIKAVGV